MPHPLILVPGLMCDASVWNPLLPALSPQAICSIVDHGDADSLDGMARRLLEQAPERFALAGHSMGGRVAVEVMRLAPERVTHLALLDTGYKARPAGPAGEDEARKRHALLDIARQQGVRAMAAQWVQGMLDPERLSDAALVEEIVAMFARKSADIFAAQIRALLGRPDASPVLREVRVPTLVACGRADSWSPLAQHEEIAALLPAHEPVHAIEDAGHMSTMEQPQAMAQLMLHWLRRPPAG
jgi:pimeloyl-ACP methyl ester carboxylesterase